MTSADDYNRTDGFLGRMNVGVGVEIHAGQQR
jgi:hypothetical protein